MMKIVKHSHYFIFYFDQTTFILLMEKLNLHSIQVHREIILNYLKILPYLLPLSLEENLSQKHLSRSCSLLFQFFEYFDLN